jgi:putative peptidoglycan lipid II flippase
VGAGILLSRLSGLVRVSVFGYFFGNSGYADAWTAALRMPNVLQNLLGEGTLSASFIPVYSELLEEGRDEDAGRFAGAALGILMAVAGALAFLGVLLAPLLVGLFFAGFDAERQAITTTLVRILFPMTGVLVISAWALGILNSQRRFFVSYVAPVLWNAAMIATLVAFGLWVGLGERDLVIALGWGALAGGVLQLGIQLPFLVRYLHHFRLSLDRDAVGVREAIRNFIPVVSARGVVNLSGWLDYALAAWLTVGAVAVLGYAQTLYLLPISLFGMAIAASELPEMSRKRQEVAPLLADRVARALERVAFFVVPSALAYLFFGDIIVAALFERGEFGEEARTVTYAVLAAYALGLLASASSRVLSSAFYALRDTRTPARIAYLRVGVSLAVGAALMFPLDRIAVGDSRLGATGLALGASLGAWLEYLLLRRNLRGKLGQGLVRIAPAPAGRLDTLDAGARDTIAAADVLDPATQGAAPVPGPHDGFARGARIVAAGAAGVAVGYGARLLLPEAHSLLVAAGTLLPFGVTYLGVSWLLGSARSIRAAG